MASQQNDGICSRRKIPVRKRFAVPSVESGLSNKAIQSLGGWETPAVVSHYASSLTFDDASGLYKVKNDTQCNRGVVVRLPNKVKSKPDNEPIFSKFFCKPLLPNDHDEV